MGKLAKFGMFEFHGILKNITVTRKGDRTVKVTLSVLISDVPVESVLSVGEDIGTCCDTPVVLRLYDPDS